jgi:uncharacterized protein involved in tolerance to divalent cations
MSHIVVFVTVGNREEASHLARVLVEERLAACESPAGHGVDVLVAGSDRTSG